MSIDNLTGNAKEFAIACYDSNTIEELQTAKYNIDEFDLKHWSITVSEYLSAIEAALAEKLKDNAA